MDLLITRALLLQISDRLTADDEFFAWLRGRARRRALALSLGHILEEHGRTAATPDLIAATRRYWQEDPGVHIDDDARQQIDRDGIWLSGWLRARTGVTAFDRIDPARLAAAIAGLPSIARQVFLLHSREDLDYGRIAARLGMSAADVQAELASALLSLDAALQDDDDGKPIA